MDGEAATASVTCVLSPSGSRDGAPSVVLSCLSTAAPGLRGFLLGPPGHWPAPWALLLQGLHGEPQSCSEELGHITAWPTSGLFTPADRSSVP